MSVGGTEGKKGMQGMSEQYRSGMRMDHCCVCAGRGGSNLFPGIDKGGKAAQG